MKRLVVSLLIISVSFFIGCSDSSSTASNSTATVQELFPMKVGNLWKYHLQTWHDDQSIEIDGPVQILVDHDTSYQGSPAFALTVFGKHEVLYYSSTNELYNAEGPPSQLRCQVPVNQEVILYDTSSTSFSRKVRILRTMNENITVPAGTFSCYQFDEVGTGIINTKLDSSSIDSYYYAPKVGIVKEEAVSFSGGRHIYRSVELTSYELK